MGGTTSRAPSVTDGKDQPGADISAERMATFRTFVQGVMQTERVPAFQVALVQDNEIKFVESFGQANQEVPVPNRNDVAFGVASVSKVMVVTTMMQLHE